jgi:hypothetical protein
VKNFGNGRTRHRFSFHARVEISEGELIMTMLAIGIVLGVGSVLAFRKETRFIGIVLLGAAIGTLLGIII